MPYLDDVHTNNQSGDAGPVKNPRDWEISFKNGWSELLHTPKVERRHSFITNILYKLKNANQNDTPFADGPNTGTMPSDPFGPSDRMPYSNKDVKVTEERIVMSYVARIIAKSPYNNFQDTIRVLQQVFQGMQMKFPEPPTYVWNPPKKGKDKDDKEDKLDPTEIKDKIKVKLPSLGWSPRSMDGIDTASLIFSDGSSAEFAIGDKANHLTVTYIAAPKKDLDDNDTSDADIDADQ